jgi:hypothetical protein
MPLKPEVVRGQLLVCGNCEYMVPFSEYVS